jgi:hypothetical protein
LQAGSATELRSYLGVALFLSALQR